MNVSQIRFEKIDPRDRFLHIPLLSCVSRMETVVFPYAGHEYGSHGVCEENCIILQLSLYFLLDTQTDVPISFGKKLLFFKMYRHYKFVQRVRRST